MRRLLRTAGIIFAAPIMLMAVSRPACAQDASSQAPPYRLTLKDAIERGLRANLSVLVAGTGVSEAQGTAERRHSLLLPHAQFQAPAIYQTLSLAAQGISVPGLPAVVGPFSTYDFRFSATQVVYDPQSFHSWKASQRQEGAARNDLQEARDQIVRLIAGLYLNAQSADAQVAAAQSRVDTSAALLKLAQDQHDAGDRADVNAGLVKAHCARARALAVVVTDE